MALKLENNIGNKFNLSHANNASDINLTSKDLASTKLVDSIAELKLINGSTADKLEVLGYYEKGDGGGGLFYWDDTSTEPDNGGTIIQATGVITGRWKRVFSGTVNVKWFGAKFDGVTDDTVAIQAANDSRGFNVIEYPYAVAILTDTVYIKKSIIGNGCLFKFNDLTVSAKAALNITNATGLTFKNFKIDGQCTITSGVANQDPTNWATQYNSFLGGSGIYSNNLDRCIFENIYISNSGAGAFKINNSADIVISNYSCNRVRSQFGDGLYLGACNRVTVTNSYANDVTRIGFVSESGSNHIEFNNCQTKTARHKSVDYGGTEYNAGFWAEQSTDVLFTHCKAESTDRGFIVVSATNVALPSTHLFNLDNCYSLGNYIGYETNVYQERAIVNLTACKSISSLDGSIAYNTIVQTGDKNIINYTACYGEVNDNLYGGHVAIFDILNKNASSYHDTINITDCTGKIVNPNSCNSSSYNNGDIIFIDGSEIGWTPTTTFGNTDLVVTNYNADNTNFFTYLRNKYTNNSNVRANFTNTKRIKIVATFPSVSFFADVLEFNACSFSSSMEISDCNELYFNNCKINNGCDFTYRGLEVSGDLFIDGGRLNHFPISSDTKKPICRLKVHGERDIATNDYIIRTNYADTNKPLLILTGSLYNSGAATATKTFVYSQGGGLNQCVGLIVDSTVTYSLKSVSTLTNLTNETLSTMH